MGESVDGNKKSCEVCGMDCKETDVVTGTKNSWLIFCVLDVSASLIWLENEYGWADIAASNEWLSAWAIHASAVEVI